MHYMLTDRITGGHVLNLWIVPFLIIMYLKIKFTDDSMRREDHAMYNLDYPIIK